MTLATDTRSQGLDESARAVLFGDAHTVHTFTDEPVTDEQLTEIWDLAKWGPSAANFQPLRVLYVQSAEGRRRLVEHLNEGNQAKTLAAPAVAVLAVDTRFHEHIPYVMPPKAQMKEMFEANPDLRGPFAEFSGSIQAGYFILAVRAAGLAAGPMGGFDKAGMDAEFFADGRLKSILVVNIGHAAAENAHHPRQPRLDPAEVLTWA